jgi:hypothetical protein
VTSVALSMPAIFSVSGSPVTTSGTLTASLATQSANTVFAGPVSGGAAAPTFRAIDSADIAAALGYVYLASAVDDTISNTGPQALASLSYTPPAGRYWASFSGNFQACSGCTLSYGIYFNGALISAATQVCVTTTRLAGHSQSVVLVDGTQAIAGGWTSSGAGTSTMHQRTLVLLRIAAS